MNVPEASKRLDHDATLAEFMSVTIGANVRRLLDNDAQLRRSVDVDAVHDARVAVRRLSSDLRTFRSSLDAASVDRLRSELAWLADLLGQVRDPQVLGRRIADHAAALEPATTLTPTAVAEITGLLAERARFRHTQLVDAMTGDRYRRLTESLRAAADDPPLRSRKVGKATARPAASRAARKQLKRARRFAASLDPSASTVELHDLRKRLKRARYAARSARRVGLGSKDSRRELASLQDRLGDHHDLVVERSFLAAEVTRFGPAAAFVAGRMLQDADHRRREMASELPDLLRRIDKIDFG